MKRQCDMICTVIQHRNLQEILDILEHCEMAEIRLDRCSLSDNDIRLCFSSDVPLVATCRVGEVLVSDSSLNSVSASMVAEKRLVAAIEAGARYVDVEVDAPRSMAKRVRRAAMENGTVFIRSWHDFEGTAPLPVLRSMVDRCLKEGAEIVKIVTMAQCAADAGNMMSLYDGAAPGSLLAFCMGNYGRETRLGCLKKGAPYTYAALDAQDVAAPGQFTADEMRREVYKGFRFLGNGADTRPVPVPSSKSFAQRAVIAAALADGTSRLSGYTPCGDNESALRVAESLGARISRQGDVIVIEGTGAGPQSSAQDSFNVGESGLLARLMIPLAAMAARGDVSISGEKTLLTRPMQGVREIMRRFSVQTESLSGGNVDGMSDDTVCVPLKVSGPLVPSFTEVSGLHGSQIISGLLMALPLAGKPSKISVHSPKSIPYMYMTLDVMKKFGVAVSNEMFGDRDFLESDGDWSYCTDIDFKIRGGQRYHAADLRIEGDWSSAANFLVAGAVFGKVVLSGLDTTSLQADLSIMDILMDAGASLSQLDGSTGDIIVQRAPLNAFETDASNCPDLFPIVAVLAAFCQGRSRIAGTDRLSHKECDRGAAIMEMLEKMGVEAEIQDNALLVTGQSLAQRLLSGTLLKGGEYSSHHDHRMAMALKVAELGADGPFVLDDTDCIAKSFPSFLELFGQLKQQ